MIKVMLADDQAILRQSIKFIIEQDKDIEVVGAAVNGREAFELCAELSPDVVLMDIMMPECDGVEGTRLIKSKYPNIKVIILTTFDSDENIKNALKNGAAGYILKDLDPDDLVLAIKSVVKGMSIMHHGVFDSVVKSVNEEEKVPERAPEKYEPTVHLTEREISVIKLIVDGKSNREISTALFITEGSVKNVVTNILEKLGLKDRTQLAVYAVKKHLI